MEFWRYLRDVLIVVTVLLLLSGLAVGWGLFCASVWLGSLAASWVLDSRLPEQWKKIHLGWLVIYQCCWVVLELVLKRLILAK